MTRVALAGLVALLVLWGAGCTDDDDPPDVVATAQAETPTAEATATPTETPSPSPTPAITPRPSATSTSAPSSTATPTEPPTPSSSPTPVFITATPVPGTPDPAPWANLPERGPEPIPAELRVRGVFTDPRFGAADALLTLEERPESTFPRFEDDHTVLYDTWTGDAVDLGRGSPGSFSADGRWMAWRAGPFTDDGVGKLIHLQTRRISDLGEVRSIVFRRNELCVSRPDGEGFELINPASAETLSVSQCPQPDPTLLRGGEWANEAFEIVQGDRVLLRSWRFAVRDRATSEDVLRVDAIHAVLVSSDELLIAAPWTGESTNIFLVDIRSREAIFIATARLEGRHPVLSLAGNDELLLWTDNMCGGPEGIEEQTSLYERGTGLVTAVDRALLARFTSNGLLGEPVYRGFGPTALLDPVSLRYVTVMPTFTATWSPDYRYASSGDFPLSFDGPCFEVFQG